MTSHISQRLCPSSVCANGLYTLPHKHWLSYPTILVGSHDSFCLQRRKLGPPKTRNMGVCQTVAAPSFRLSRLCWALGLRLSVLCNLRSFPQPAAQTIPWGWWVKKQRLSPKWEVYIWTHIWGGETAGWDTEVGKMHLSPSVEVLIERVSTLLWPHTYALSWAEGQHLKIWILCFQENWYVSTQTAIANNFDATREILESPGAGSGKTSDSHLTDVWGPIFLTDTQMTRASWELEPPCTSHGCPKKQNPGNIHIHSKWDRLCMIGSHAYEGWKAPNWPAAGRRPRKANGRAQPQGQQHQGRELRLQAQGKSRRDLRLHSQAAGVASLPSVCSVQAPGDWMRPTHLGGRDLLCSVTG